MPTYDPTTKTYILTEEEQNYALAEDDFDVHITGNALDNILTGNGTDNRLDGNGGRDTLIGGAGDDRYVLRSVDVTITELADEGDDLIISYIDVDLNDHANVEHAILDGTALHATGSSGSNQIYGNGLANILDGGEGDDILESAGGNDTLDGGRGADQMTGGLGDDVYVVDDLNDIVVEAEGGGTDRVEALIGFSLAPLAHIENLTLIGTGSIDGTGNELVNVIVGNGGNNILDGKAGSDRLEGGAGNDTYVIDADDTLLEGENGGTDTVRITDAYAPATYTLSDNFENLAVAGARDFTATGNALNNNLTGSGGADTFKGEDGNDTLDGGGGADHLEGGKGDDMLLGGAGADMMIGGLGNDLYFVDSSGDTVTEEAGGGAFDRVIAKVSYALTANVEYLALENAGGNINGTGNALDNTMFGNGGSNVLDGGAGRDQLYGATGADTVHGGDGDDSIHEAGGDNDMLYGDAGNDSLEGEGGDDLLDGGTGADSLKGGAGNDTYVVDSSADLVTETAGGGFDTVQAGASFALALDAEVEALTAMGKGALDLSGSDTANALLGNAAANRLRGNGGNDTISGQGGKDRLSGGLGNDVLTGGSDSDVFVFDAAPNRKANLDRIVDFNVRDDTIWLDNAVFRKLGKGTEAKPGKLNKGFFTIGSKAKDKNDFLVYDSKKGVLFYDLDGSGKGKAVEIASLKKGLKMTELDFFVV
ncbi:calcium-binding protein [Microvirga thermotolerans]|uniref:Calcium-binding protein n=1 Tax=Microvirga thermotolerans TaxID=2651334 RepID=A0A5P9JYA4_9HYPH|nr:calcium-binding protein [Microvirga thermotolerans]QFU17413.1 hypothetical protein GDR74_14975 [Microvirga thermotolerans]